MRKGRKIIREESWILILEHYQKIAVSGEFGIQSRFEGTILRACKMSLWTL